VSPTLTRSACLMSPLLVTPRNAMALVQRARDLGAQRATVDTRRREGEVLGRVREAAGAALRLETAAWAMLVVLGAVRARGRAGGLTCMHGTRKACMERGKLNCNNWVWETCDCCYARLDTRSRKRMQACGPSYRSCLLTFVSTCCRADDRYCLFNCKCVDAAAAFAPVS
jgi:hypothetical protein